MTTDQINLTIAEWAGEWESAGARVHFGDDYDRGIRWMKAGSFDTWFEAALLQARGRPWHLEITRIPFDYTTSDEAVRRALGRLSRYQLMRYAYTPGYIADDFSKYDIEQFLLATTLQKATALARMIVADRRLK